MRNRRVGAAHGWSSGAGAAAAGVNVSLPIIVPLSSRGVPADPAVFTHRRCSSSPRLPLRFATRRPPAPSLDAIRQGAERTGTGFDYLLATAQRESALDPSARARSSSASGLFQFIEQTWLGLIKSDGPRLGLAQQASAIQTRSDGTHVVSDPATRQAILNLREDPKVASVMAGTLTQRNRETLAQGLGREPSAGDLYAAHFLGARGAAQLIERRSKRRPVRPPATSRRRPPPIAASSSTATDGRAAPGRSTSSSPPSTPA